MAISNGLTSAITNPLLPDVRAAIKAADVLMGHDQDCASWIANCRPTIVAGEAADGAGAGAGRGRRVNRRAVVAAV